MSTYAIDSTAQALRATGIVEPITEWHEDPATGKRRPSDVQARDDHGVPLWGVEVSYLSESWGRQATVVAKVTLPSPEQPAVSAFEVVPFQGLAVTVSPIKGGGIRENWTASGIATPAHSRKSDAA